MGLQKRNYCYIKEEHLWKRGLGPCVCVCVEGVYVCEREGDRYRESMWKRRSLWLSPSVKGSVALKSQLVLDNLLLQTYSSVRYSTNHSRHFRFPNWLGEESALIHSQTLQLISPGQARLNDLSCPQTALTMGLVLVSGPLPSLRQPGRWEFSPEAAVACSVCSVESCWANDSTQ